MSRHARDTAATRSRHGVTYGLARLVIYPNGCRVQPGRGGSRFSPRELRRRELTAVNGSVVGGSEAAYLRSNGIVCLMWKRGLSSCAGSRSGLSSWYNPNRINYGTIPATNHGGGHPNRRN
eukprot:1843656-Prymnesium_polylepis.1